MTALIRPATFPDIPAIADIYGHAVSSSIATFDYVAPPPSHWEHKITSTVNGNHILVIEVEGKVLGYAYSDEFRSRLAYAQTRETSVYLSPDAGGAGLGSKIYHHLLSLLREDHMHVAVAVISSPNPASVALHEKLGFERVGTMREVGRKFDTWIDTHLYQLMLHDHGNQQPDA